MFKKIMAGIKKMFVEQPVFYAQSINPSPTMFCYNDPSTPDLMEDVDLPTAASLKTSITGFEGGGAKWGSLQAQAAQCYVSINSSLNYILKKAYKPINKWAATPDLIVTPRAGNDLNAYYDRKGLRFFFHTDKKTKETIYTSESNEVVSHELGHALLDAVRPEFWNYQSLEVHAFHEAFGDCVAILSTLQFNKVIDYVLTETDGDLNKSNVVSRVGEELGTAIYKIDPNSGRESGVLRDANNNFTYVKPENLPTESPDNELSSECHNFSRVWTGTWYEMMVKIYEYNCFHMDKKQALIKARDTSANYLMYAIAHAPASVRLYTALAKQILICDKTYGSPYGKIIEKVFTKRKIPHKEIKLLSNVNFKDLDDKILALGKTTTFTNGKTIVVEKKQEFKLIDRLGISTMSNNPLFNVEISMPMDEYYEFDENGNLIDETKVSEAEILDSAYNCLQHLHKKNLVGPNSNQPFEVRNGKLSRNHFACDFGCNQNCRNPTAPEYGKCKKCRNNAGCGGGGCGCEAEPTTPTPRVKLGCYTTVKTGGFVSRKVGSSLSRRTC